MEIEQRRAFRDAPTSDCRSFGSHNRPCSQSRKISIGVMAEEPAKVRHATTKDGETKIPNAENAVSSGGKIMEKSNKVPGAVSSWRGKQGEALGQENSPWLSTRSVAKAVQFSENRASVLQYVDASQRTNGTHKPPVTKTVQFLANKTSVLQSVNGGQKQYETPMTRTVEFYTNQTSILQSSNGVQKKFDSITYGRTRKKDGGSERVHEFAYAAAQEVRESDGADDENKNSACQGKDALRLKLWEILGTAPQDNEHNTNSQTPEDGVKNSELGDHLDQKGGEEVRPRQSSDTIETDSESPNGTTRRPVTRSLTRKKGPTAKEAKLPRKMTNGGKLPTSLNNKQKCQEKNIFSFHEAEGGLGSFGGAVNGGSSLFSSKKNQRKSSTFEPRRISFSGKISVEKSRGTTDKVKKKSPLKKSTSQSSRKESFHSFPPQPNLNSFERENGNVDEELHNSTRKMAAQEDVNSPNLPNKADVQGNQDFMFLKKVATKQYKANSPTSGTKAPIENDSPTAPSPITSPKEPGVESPRIVNRKFMSESFCNLRNSNTKAASSGSDAETESPDDSRKLGDLAIKESLNGVKEKDDEDCLSESSKEQDVESMEEDVLKKGCRIAETWTPEVGTYEKPSFMLRPSKRFCIQERTAICEYEPTPPSPKGTISESDALQGLLDQNQDDGLPRAVALFAFALERFKTRMKAETTKRSSEVLVSVAEGIKLQLQNVDSQIQGDIMKFTSLGKSKRKRLETRFQEQQERLKHIQDKFKEDVNHHLQDCRSTLDDLEAYQMELKGNVERQNTSHKKLLLQVEQTIETQLGDAERRITNIQQVARDKMLQLKHVISECLKDGVFS